MFRSSKIWWAVAVLFILLYIPGKGHAGPDKYDYTTIIGRVTLEFDYKKRGDEENHTTAILQEYSLDVTGNFLNRLLVVYDAGIEYTQKNTAYASTKFMNNFHSYYLRTTILPKSAIPFSLHGRRSVSGSTSTNTYGLKWSGLFRRLPRTRFGATRTDAKGTSLKSQRTDYDLKLTKKTSRYRSEFDTSLTKNENKLTSAENTNSAMNLTNKIEISRSTSLQLSAARGVSKGDTIPKMTVQGVWANIHSKPSTGVKQTHSYSYYENKNDEGTSTVENYNGAVSYDFSTRLTSDMRLLVQRDDSEQSTIKRETDLTRASGHLTYKASSKLSLSERVEYSMVDFYGSEAGLSRQIDYTSLSMKTNAAYKTKLSWAAMYSAYSVGYSEETSTDSSGGGEIEGKALSQSLSLDFAGIDVKGYANVNTGGSYSDSTEFEGNLDSTAAEFHIFTQNKVWRNYVRLIGSYERSEVKSNIADRNEFIDTLRFNAKTLYLTKYLNKRGNGRTGLSFNAIRTNMSNNTNLIAGATSTTKDLNLTHNRVLFRGLLNISIQSMDTQSESGDSVSKSLRNEIRGDYARPLLRRISWKATALHKRVTVNKAKTRASAITNMLNYRLRAWSLSAEHRYNTQTYGNTKSTEHRVLLKASRTFIRILL